MDGSTFDRLTQLMVGRTRRFALKAACGAAGATVGMAAMSGSEARNKHKNKAKRCKKKLKKCRKSQPPACEPLLIGQPCQTTSQCCGTETNLACAQPNSDDGSATRACCGTATVPCTGDNDCCLGFACARSGQCVEILP